MTLQRLVPGDFLALSSVDWTLTLETKKTRNQVLCLRCSPPTAVYSDQLHGGVCFIDEVLSSGQGGTGDIYTSTWEQSCPFSS